MLYEIMSVTLWLIAASLVAVVFFCNVELAPLTARILARESRYVDPKAKERLVRFW